MSLIQIKNALDTRLSALSGGLPTSWENAAFTPPADGAPYQEVWLLPAPPENPTIAGAGTNPYRERGVYQITLRYPTPGGARSAILKAEAIRDWFPRGASFTSGGITTIVQGTPAIGIGRSMNGRYVLPVSISYFSNVNM